MRRVNMYALCVPHCPVTLCRQKQKSLLDGVVLQREALQQRLYQSEVQVGL